MASLRQIQKMENRRILRQNFKRRSIPTLHTLLLRNNLITKRYQLLLLGVVDTIRKIVASKLKTELPRWVAAAGFVHDAWDKEIDSFVKQTSLSISGGQDATNFDLMTKNIGQDVSNWHSKKWQGTIKKVLGKDLYFSEPQLPSLLEGFATENVALIKSMSEKTFAGIESQVLTSIKQGKRAEDIAVNLESIYGASEKSAKLIARDQVSKLYGQLDKYRQTNAGLDRYIWRNMRDERVRGNPSGKYPNAEPSHWQMNGKLCSWSDPTIYYDSKGIEHSRSEIDGPEEHPGDEIQCRCYAEPYFNDILEV